LLLRIYISCLSSNTSAFSIVELVSASVQVDLRSFVWPRAAQQASGQRL